MQKLSLCLHIETVRKSLFTAYIPKKNVYKNFYCVYAVRWKMCTKIVMLICGLGAILLCCSNMVQVLLL